MHFGGGGAAFGLVGPSARLPARHCKQTNVLTPCTHTRTNTHKQAEGRAHLALARDGGGVAADGLGYAKVNQFELALHKQVVGGLRGMITCCGCGV